MKNIIVLGTSSSVGKTTIATALCHYFAKTYDVVPFKAFNLSSETFIYNGATIGYAQYLQSLAANKEYVFQMNPILKSFSNNTCKYYIEGQEKTNLTIAQQKTIAWKAYENLSDNHQLVICEGSGSFMELNLLDYDYANLSFASHNNLAIFIVCDISMGGVFGNILGHIKLMSKEQLKLVKGIIVNKFDGDAESFREGKQMIEELCGIKVVGVVESIKIELPNEDTMTNEVVYNIESLKNEIEIVSNKIIDNLDITYIEDVVKGVF